MKTLLYLDVGYNKIFELPDLGNMPQLIEIDLQHNSLCEFPHSLLQNPKLTHIYLMGNAFVITKEEREALKQMQEKLGTKGIRMFY